MLPRSRSWLAVGLAGLLVSPALSACSGSDGLGGDFSVEEALEALPDASDEDFLDVRVADLDEATDLAGTEPGDDDWLESLYSDTVYVPLPTTFIQQADTGVELEDTTSFASLRSTDGGLIDVYRLRDGDPPDDSDDVAGLVRVSEDDDEVVLASDDDWVDRWRDREDASLADDDGFRGMAEALDDQDVYAAQLFTTPQDTAVTAFGVGQTVDDDEPVELAVFALEDGEDVGERADEIEAAWEDTQAARDGQIEIEEVDTDGQVVIVRLRPEKAGAAYESLISRLDFDFPE